MKKFLPIFSYISALVFLYATIELTKNATVVLFLVAISFVIAFLIYSAGIVFKRKKD